jgi:hypothetical protein
VCAARAPRHPPLVDALPQPGEAVSHEQELSVLWNHLHGALPRREENGGSGSERGSGRRRGEERGSRSGSGRGRGKGSGRGRGREIEEGKRARARAREKASERARERESENQQERAQRGGVEREGRVRGSRPGERTSKSAPRQGAWRERGG